MSLKTVSAASRGWLLDWNGLRRNYAVGIGSRLQIETTLFFKLINLFLAALGLRCCLWAFSSCSERGLLFDAVCGLLIAVASPVVEHELQVHGLQQLWHAGSVIVARGLQSAGSVAVAHGLRCSAACGIFADQGSNPCPLHWQRLLNHCATREVPETTP